MGIIRPSTGGGGGGEPSGDYIPLSQKAIGGGVATLDGTGKIPKTQISLNASDVGAIASETDPTVSTFTKGLTNNDAILSAVNAATGTISASRLPSYNELNALQSLADTTGFLRKIGDGSYSIDTSSYLPLTGGTVSGSITAASFSGSGASLTNLNASNLSGTIPVNSLPSAVYDVLSYANLASFPVTGTTGKIYIAEDTNKSYRWTGSGYALLSSGSADAAVKLATARTISASGDATWTVSFDGSGNATAELTLATVNATTGTFGSATQSPVFVVDGKGRITEVLRATITPAWTSILGKPTTLSGFGITDAQPLGNELTALQALADTSGFLKKTGNGTYSVDASIYLPTTGGTITGTTPSTSSTTGALVLNGGLGIGGSVYAGGSFNGNGSGLTSLNASNISSGTISAARLPDSYLPLGGGAITGDITISGKIGNTLAIGEATRSSSIGLNILNTLQANGSRYSVQSILNIDNTATLTAARSSYGQYSEISNSLSSTNKSTFVHNIFGGYFYAKNGINLTDDTGANNIYGCYNWADNRSATGTTPTLLIGAFNRASVNGTLGVTNVRASHNYSLVNSAAAVSDLVGSLNIVQTANAGAAVTDAYAVNNILTNSNGTITNAYGVYTTFTGTFGTKWGIYSNGDSKNYLTGDLGLGVDPAYKLDVSGSARVSSNYFVGNNQVVSSRKTGWTAATGTATRTTFSTGTATTVQVAERLKALIDDLIAHGLIGT